MQFTARHQPPAAAAAITASFAGIETGRTGCGWFDSSFELSHGLDVTEGLDLCEFELWSQALRLQQANTASPSSH